MFDIVLLLVGCLVLLGLFLKAILSITHWCRRRPMRKELDRRNIPYDPHDGLGLELIYYRALQKDIQKALNDRL